jgi:hypothetical protein
MVPVEAYEPRTIELHFRRTTPERRSRACTPTSRPRRRTATRRITRTPAAAHPVHLVPRRPARAALVARRRPADPDRDDPRPPVQGRLVPRDWGVARRRDLTRTATRTRSPTARRPVRQPTLSHTALILHAVPGEARHRPRTTDRRGEGRRSNPLQTGLIPAPAARSAQTPHSRYE